MSRKINLPIVNAHAHSAMVGFRGLAEDLPLQRWLEEHIWPAEKREVTADFVYAKTKEAIAEMRKNGIRLFLDMYFFEEEVARAAKEAGLPVVIGEGILDFPTPSARTPDEALEKTEQLLREFRDDPLVKVAVAPHSIYTVSRENLLRAGKLAEKYTAPLHIHLAETRREFDDCLERNGKTPTAYLDELGLLDERAVLAHCVWMTDQDLDLVAARKSSVVHCPLSNLKLGSGIAPVAKMLEREINVCLGTDGAASSNRLDIWEAGKIAALLQKGCNFDPTEMPSKTAIKMMTVNGLKALGFSQFGEKNISVWEAEIEAGKDWGFLYALNVEEIDFE